jgi:hypothetical protein
MNVRAQPIVKPRTRAEPGTGFLYGWLLLVLFIEYARPASVFTFLDFPFFYSIPPLSLLVVTLFAPGLRSMQEIFADKITKWVFILLGLVFVSVLLAPMKEIAWNIATMVLGRVFLFVMICRLMTSESRIRGVIVTLFLAHAFLLSMNMDVLLNPETRNYIDGATFLGDGNDFSLSLCLLLPCMVEIALASRKTFVKVIAWAGVTTMVLAVVATQSRGGTLGLIAVFGYLWWRSPKKLVTMIAIGMIGIAVLAFAPPEYYTRMATMQDTASDGSAQGRINAWKGAIGMGAKNPLGIGAGHFGARWGLTAHSTYMLAFAELGPLGLTCVLMLVFGNLRANARLRAKLLQKALADKGQALRESTRMLDLMNAGMVGFAVAGAFLSATYYPHVYVLSGLLISARILAARRAGLPVSKRP